MFERFRYRSNELERLDKGEYTPEEYAKWQREMEVIHRIGGEMRALRRTLHRSMQERGCDGISILDVGAGSGNILDSIRRWKSNGDGLVVGAELNDTAALSISSKNIAAVRCDALTLPFADGSFDFVICCLVLHHLSDGKAVELLAEMGRVSNDRIFIVDLHRKVMAYYFYRAIGSVFLQPFSREDGSLSILRSFRPNELRELAERAGLRNIEVKRSAFYRLVLSGE